MHRNGFYIPSIKSTIITCKYMLDVGEGRIYAPTYDEVRMAPWRKRLPSRKEIIKELIKSTKRH